MLSANCAPKSSYHSEFSNVRFSDRNVDWLVSVNTRVPVPAVGFRANSNSVTSLPATTQHQSCGSEAAWRTSRHERQSARKPCPGTSAKGSRGRNNSTPPSQISTTKGSVAAIFVLPPPPRSQRESCAGTERQCAVASTFLQGCLPVKTKVEQARLGRRGKNKRSYACLQVLPPDIGVTANSWRPKRVKQKEKIGLYI